MAYKGKGGLQYNLSSKPLAAGGEGEIYNIIGQPTLVAKLYKSGKTSIEKEKKLVKMVTEPPEKNVLSQIAWPQDVLYNNGQFVGFIMPKMDISEDLNVIYEYGSSAKYPDMLWESRLIIAQNLCAVLDSVHIAGHTCGDFNPKNISVNPKTGQIMFLDTDSYHIQDGIDTYRCDVGIPEYLPAEVQVKMRGGGTLVTAKLPTFSQNTDNFALAIHIFQLLMNGVHPFTCAIIPSQSSVTAPQPSDNIIKGEFPFMQKLSGIRIPSYAPPVSILPKYMQDLFERAFIDGHRNPNCRPTPIDWHQALQALRKELKTCGKVSHHQYYENLSTCPWCDVDNKFSQQFKPKSTLTQTIIKAPSTSPAPSVTAPKNSYSLTSTSIQSVTHTPASMSSSVTAPTVTIKKYLRNIACILAVLMASFAAIVLIKIPSTDDFPGITPMKATAVFFQITPFIVLFFSRRESKTLRGLFLIANTIWSIVVFVAANSPASGAERIMSLLVVSTIINFASCLVMFVSSPFTAYKSKTRLTHYNIGPILKWTFLILTILATPLLFSLNIPHSFFGTNLFLVISLLPLVLLFRNRRMFHIIACIALSLIWIFDSLDVGFGGYGILGIVEPIWTLLYILSWISSIAEPSYTDNEWSKGAIIAVVVVGIIILNILAMIGIMPY